MVVSMMTEEELKLRKETLSILLKNFDDNRAIYELSLIHI